jgi:hypothetical protein
MALSYISGFNFIIKHPTELSPGKHLAFSFAAQIPTFTHHLPALIIPGVIGNDINMEVNIHMLSICHQSMLHLGNI